MSFPNALPCLELETEPGIPPSISIIALHGLGADGHDLASLAGALSIQQPIRWLFPHAPERPISLYGGALMRAWYDIYGLDFGSLEDETGLRASAQSIEWLIQREQARGIPFQRILLGGFSQGGALALYAGLRYSHRLAGICALSSYLPLAKLLASERSPASLHTPIFIAHGEQDKVVSLEMGKWSRNQLRALGYQVVFHLYEIAHSLCTQEIEDMAAWIQRVV